MIFKILKAGNSYCPENSVGCSNMIGTHNCTCEDGLLFDNKVKRSYIEYITYYRYSTVDLSVWVCPIF